MRPSLSPKRGGRDQDQGDRRYGRVQDSAREGMQHLGGDDREKIGPQGDRKGAMAAIPPAATRHLLRIASTSAPPGTWLTMLAMVPELSYAPMAPCVHPALIK